MEFFQTLTGTRRGTFLFRLAAVMFLKFLTTAARTLIAAIEMKIFVLLCMMLVTGMLIMTAMMAVIMILLTMTEIFMLAFSAR